MTPLRSLAAVVILGALGPALASREAQAVEYYGRVMVGVYQSDETEASPVEGTDSNDQRALLGRGYLDVTGIGPFRNEFVLDFRDKYDEFGKRDDKRIALTESNEPELRQLAVKYPFEGDRIFWSLGRFPVEDAGVVANDGAEVGYKLTGNWRAGLFGGLIPDPTPGKSLTLTPEDREVGTYATYQSRTKEWWQHSYFANGLVVRQTQEEPEVLGDGTTEEAGPGSGLVSVTNANLYSQSIYQPRQGTRISAVGHLNLAPSAYLRNFWGAYFRQLTPSFSGTASVMRLDLTEYRKVRDIRETIGPSGYTQGKLSVLQKMNKRLGITADALYGTREDGLMKYESAPGVRLTQLLNNKVSVYGRGGFRRNFTSKDTFVIAGGDFYAKKFELGVAQEYRIENREGGESLHAMITDASVSTLLADAILGSAMIEYSKDENVAIMSGLLTLGFRFGSRQMTPFIDSARPVERVQ